MSIEDEIEERKHRVEAIKLALDGFFNERERRVPVGLKEKRNRKRTFRATSLSCMTARNRFELMCGSP
jgi:hypothetical protein